MSKTEKKKRKKNSLAEKDQDPASQNGSNNHIIAQASYSGPIPRSSELAGYESIVPGAADRIIRMAEKNQNDHSNITNRSLTANMIYSFLGQLFALVATLASFYTTIRILEAGYPVAATFSGGITVCGLAAVFIKGRKID